MGRGVIRITAIRGNVARGMEAGTTPIGGTSSRRDGNTRVGSVKDGDITDPTGVGITLGEVGNRAITSSGKRKKTE